MKWIKPNGTRIETNDMKATVVYCKSLGWVEAEVESNPDEDVKSDAEKAGYPPEPKQRKKPGPKPRQASVKDLLGIVLPKEVKPKKKANWSEG